MKLTINKNKFKKHLESVVKIIPSATALPSLYGVLLKANGSLLTMIASDGNLSIKEEVEIGEKIRVVEPGEALIPGKLFRDVLSKHGNEVEVTFDETKAQIVSEGITTDINLLNYKDYPMINFDVIGKEVSIEAALLKKAIKNVSFAAADNDRRLILNGVNLSGGDGTLTATATNSFRLAQEKINVNSNTDFNITLLPKNLKEFLPANASGLINLKIDNTKVITNFGGTTIYSKLIDGIYPEVEKLIPKNFNHTITIQAKELSDVIEKAIVVSDSEKKIIRLTANSSELSIESRRREMGSSIAKTTNLAFEGEEIIIPFNAQFLKDAINKFEGEVKVMFVGEGQPFVVKSSKESEVLQLILPHRNF